ncbi:MULTISPECIES: hypothetical protein [unclassified Methylobacterium]|uniref:hypothetical protein n=1 Tax=unclassified Methylobacterium TaxID=2615210 RepID=UPI0013541808|nr:hypothetical protein [Methylobacterium sp. 2A]MWV24145.1 hypothetical protein [Methylobacterium sp. 2A]
MPKARHTPERRRLLNTLAHMGALAIARGFVEAKGGTVTAANWGDRRGACFTMTPPVPNRVALQVIAA